MFVWEYSSFHLLCFTLFKFAITVFYPVALQCEGSIYLTLWELNVEAYHTKTVHAINVFWTLYNFIKKHSILFLQFYEWYPWNKYVLWRCCGKHVLWCIQEFIVKWNIILQFKFIVVGQSKIYYLLKRTWYLII